MIYAEGRGVKNYEHTGKVEDLLDIKEKISYALANRGGVEREYFYNILGSVVAGGLYVLGEHLDNEFYSGVSHLGSKIAFFAGLGLAMCNFVGLRNSIQKRIGLEDEVKKIDEALSSELKRRSKQEALLDNVGEVYP